MTQIYWVLYQDSDTAQAVRDIMGRTQTVEMDWGGPKEAKSGVVRRAESCHLVEPRHGHGPCLREAFSMELDAFDFVKRLGRQITLATT